MERLQAVCKTDPEGNGNTFGGAPPELHVCMFSVSLPRSPISIVATSIWCSIPPIGPFGWVYFMGCT